MKIGIIYGSTSGNTENAASVLQGIIGSEKADVKNVAALDAGDYEVYDFLILGTSTWGIGDLQDDWESCLDKLSDANLSGKKVAVFGLGDAEGYPDSFVDGIADLYDAAAKAGAQLVGHVGAEEYSFDASKALRDGVFIGLPLDEDNESDATQSRLENWVSQLGLA